MGIKENKIPPPSEIKTSPYSFDEQEIENIRVLRDQINQIAFQFGQLQISILKLEEQESLLKSKMKDLEKQESVIAKRLTSKYGKGSIDLETGTFTPIK